MNVNPTSISFSILKLTLIQNWVMGERLHCGAGSLSAGIWVWPACVGGGGEMVDMRPFTARWSPSVSLSFETLAFPVVLGNLDHDMKKSLSLGLLGRQIFILCWTIGPHSFIHSEMFIEQVCVQHCTGCCPYIPLKEHPSQRRHRPMTRQISTMIENRGSEETLRRSDLPRGFLTDVYQ